MPQDSFQVERNSMVKIEPFPHKIRAFELPLKREVAIPSKFIVDEKFIISIEEFKANWINREFDPILIGEGISLKKMEELDEDFFSGLKVDFYDGNLFVVDFPQSVEHGFSALHITNEWWAALKAHFQNFEDLCDRTGTGNFFGMQADDSFTFLPELSRQRHADEVPFLAVEAACAQSMISLEEKISRWFSVGVLFVVGVKRYPTGKILIFLRQKNQATNFFEKESWIGQKEIFTIPIDKELIFRNYLLRNFNLQPDLPTIDLPVNIRFR